MIEGKGMAIEIDGSTVHVPENLVEEYLNFMQCNREYLSGRLLKKAEIFKNCLIENNKYNPETFETRFANYLDNDLDIYRR